MGVCKSNQSQMVRSLMLDAKNNSLPNLLVFRNSSLDAPWEKVAHPRHVKNRYGTISPGNPGPMIFPYSGAEANYCPLSNFDERNYNHNRLRRDRHTGVATPTNWGDYSLFHGKVTRNQERFGRSGGRGSNSIRKVNDQSENVVFVDVGYNAMKTKYFDYGWESDYEHYNASFNDGSAKFITTKRLQLNYWLWDSPNWAR